MKASFVIPIILVLLGVQIAGTMLAVPVVDNNLEVFDDPDSLESPLVYLGLVILMSIIILILFRYGLQRVVSLVFFLGVWAVTYFVSSAILGTMSVPFDVVSFIIAVIAVILIWKFPEWYVIDGIGFVVCAGATALLGASFGILPAVLLLVVFAAYDAISVYKTKHMLSLAENVLTSKLPALFIVPRTRDFSYRDQSTWRDLDDVAARPAYIIGMGDIVIPSMLVVSSSVFFEGMKVFGLFTLPAIGAMIGSYVGLVALQMLADRYPQAHAGLPLLNGCTLLGFAVAYLIAGVI